jgi:hypothetical protein
MSMNQIIFAKPGKDLSVMRELFNPRHFTCGQLEHDRNKKYPGLMLAPLPELPLTG